MTLLRGFVVLVAVALGIWLVLVLLAWGLQRQIIYLPDRRVPPSAAGVEEVTLTADDGLELGAWFVAPDDEPLTTILVASGNAGHRGYRLPFAAGLADRGHAVLLLDYRGYGGNPGRPDEEGLLADARAARRYLEGRTGVEPDRVVYYGESLGSAVVAALAVEDPPAALMLRSPFPELADVGRRHYPFLPVRTLLRDRFPTAQHLQRYDGPTLVVAGEDDSIVPTALSRQVADDAGATYAQIPGADHNDPALLDGTPFLDALDAFLRDTVGES